MKKYKLTFFIILTAFLISCEITADIDAEHDSVIQIDAVFFTGEPMPVIEIKRSFSTPASSQIDMDRESIMVSGAEIELKYNGQVLLAEEELAGRYRPISNELVKEGDTFEILVGKEGKSASAVAKVPDYPVEEIEITTASGVELRERFSPETGMTWNGGLAVNIYLPFLPDFTAIQLLSEMEAEFYEDEETRAGAPRALEFYTYTKKEYSGMNSLSADQVVTVFYLHEEGEEKPAGNRTLSVYSTIVIPESIYETWHSTHSENLVPVTITNVEGGVGLFIGAMRVKKEMLVNVDLK